MLSPLKVPGESIMFWGILGCDAPQAQGKQAEEGLSGSRFRIQGFYHIWAPSPVPDPAEDRAGKGGALLGLRCSCAQNLTRDVIRGGDKMKGRKKKAYRVDRCKRAHTKASQPRPNRLILSLDH